MKPTGDMEMDTAIARSMVLPRRKEFEVEDLQGEIHKLKIRIDLLTKERDQLAEMNLKLQQDVQSLRNLQVNDPGGGRYV